ncbi:kinesin-like protein [Tilletia horrida]|nr:kinesin-like protein [Tilletia horrida]
MATSMQFGPEWMRKAANRSSSSLSKEPASPNPSAFPDAAGNPLGAPGSHPTAAAAAAAHGPGHGQHTHSNSNSISSNSHPASATFAASAAAGLTGGGRKPSLGSIVSSSSGAAVGGAGAGAGAGGGGPGPLPVSPAVPSPGAFSFAAAAAGLSASEREQRDRDRASGTVTMGSGRLRLIKRGLTENGPPSPNPGSPLATSHSSPFAPPATPSSPSATPVTKPSATLSNSTTGSTGTGTGTAAAAAGAGASAAAGSGSAASATAIPNSPGLGRGPSGAWPGSRLHRQRSLADGGGPIGPPADGSAGFHKFAGYDRKRERQQSTSGPTPGNGSAANPGSRTASGASNGLGGSADDDADASRRSSITASTGSLLGHPHSDSVNGATAAERSNGHRHNGNDSLADSVSALDLGAPAGSDTPSWSPDKAFWQYRDPTGQVQGPFSAVNMQDWYKQNYFTSDLLVKRQEEEEFRPLGVVLAELGDTATPFLQPPPSKRAPPVGPPGLQPVPQKAPAREVDKPADPTLEHQQLNGSAASAHQQHQSASDEQSVGTPNQSFQSIETGSIGGSSLGPVDYRGEGVWPGGRMDGVAGIGGGGSGHLADQLTGGPHAVGPDGAGGMHPGLGQRRPWPNLDLDLGGFGAAGGVGGGVPGSPFGPNGVPRSPFTPGAGLLGMSPHPARQAAGIPGSPFGVPSVANLDLDARLRQQEEMIVLARQRELQEQRQAAAAAAARSGYGVGMGPGMNVGVGGLAAEHFGGLHTPGRRGWDELPPSAGAAPSGPAPWQQFVVPPQNMPNPGGPAAFYESFSQAQRPMGPGAPAPWASSPITTARMPFEQQQQQQQQPLAPQGGPDDPFGASQQNAALPPPSPWSHAPAELPTAAATSDHGTVPQPQPVHHDEPVLSSHDSSVTSPISSQVIAPVGTPRRSRSPAPASAADVQAASEVPVEAQPATEEIAEPAPVAPEPESEASLQEEPAVEEAPAQEEAAEDPEQLWPADPSAVEFAPEPSFDDMSGSKSKFDDAASAQAARRTRRGGRHLRSDSNDDERDGELSSGHASGNVRLVSQEHFKRGSSGPNSAVEAPLSAWLPDAGGQASTPVSAKPAPWASKADDEGNASSGPSLREIQAAEARNAEAKRNAQRAAAERVAKASALSPSSNDPPLPSTMSWGLASVPPNGPKESPIAPSIQPGGNAWSHKAPLAATGGPKKTLMEIQEEERKRAQRQAELRSAQAAAIRKGYADSASRSISNPHPHPSSAAAAAAQGANAGAAAGSAGTAGSGTGAWSVVGAGGKTSSTPSAGPPGVARAVSATTTAQRVASGPASGSSWGSAAAAAGAGAASSSSLGKAAGVKAALGTSASSAGAGGAASAGNGARKPSARPGSGAPGAESYSPSSPSPEFLQYCKDHLKGLSIRVDDFIEMLLSFPLDPTPDVIEIIAESVYANSSTLDGRRFASDFVAKRKLDAKGHFASSHTQGHGFGGFDGGSGSGLGGVAGVGSGSGGSGSAGGSGGGAWTPAGRTASEVLKSQPSAGKNESPFGFKVVKAKGNKKRN